MAGQVSGDRSPPNGDNTRITLAVLRNEIVHRFQSLNEKIDRLEQGQSDLAREVGARLERHGEDLGECKRRLTILEATAIRLDVIKITAVVSFGALVILSVATVVTKIVGLW